MKGGNTKQYITNDHWSLSQSEQLEITDNRKVLTSEGTSLAPGKTILPKASVGPSSMVHVLQSHFPLRPISLLCLNLVSSWCFSISRPQPHLEGVLETSNNFLTTPQPQAKYSHFLILASDDGRASAFFKDNYSRLQSIKMDARKQVSTAEFGQDSYLFLAGQRRKCAHLYS